jgi:predicted nucleic acid-binding protein
MSWVATWRACSVYHSHNRNVREYTRILSWCLLVGTLQAALLSLEHKLPLADSIILATARAHKATLWTQDEHFKNLPGVEYIEKK